MRQLTLPFGPEVGAVCGKAARTDLGGGREVTRVPTAKNSLHCICRLLCRFSDAGNDDLATRSGDRRPKSAKARNRGRYGHRVQAGFESTIIAREDAIKERKAARCAYAISRSSK